MAKKKVYAVKKGKVTGIFLTWEECKESVDGYPGAEYKGFATDAEAYAYLGISNPGAEAEKESDENSIIGSEELVIAKKTKSSVVRDFPNQVVAYVDGSFEASIGRYAFGCVIITPEGEIIREFGNGDNPESAALRNVTGEMLGAMYVVQWCVKKGYSAVNIRYDYSGVEMWVTGAWKAKTELTQKYAAYMQRNARNIDISFQKIAAHTGDYYNEEADKLAKRGLTEGNGIPPVT